VIKKMQRTALVGQQEFDDKERWARASARFDSINLRTNGYD